MIDQRAPPPPPPPPRTRRWSPVPPRARLSLVSGLCVLLLAHPARAQESETATEAKPQQTEQTPSPPSDTQGCAIPEADRDEVVARLKKMRPKAAAKLLAALPAALAADLLLGLDARRSARIMDELPPHSGAAIVALLSGTPSP